MSILTPFFNLLKLAKTDNYSIDQFNANMDIIDTEMHRPPLTVNLHEPDPETRDIDIRTVPLADNLSSDEAQMNMGTFIERTSGGDASIADGPAWLSELRGNQVKSGYVAESLQMTVNAAARPQPITATLNQTTFKEYVETAGTYTLTYTTEWSADPALYGVTVANMPVSGDEIVIVWDGTNDAEMTVNAVARPQPITATIDRDTFVAYVSTSGTITLTYGSAWSADPTLYGVTVNGTPYSGDQIVIVYVKENRGTITTAAPTSYVSTGWNLYNHAVGYARVVNYSEEYGFMIDGTYTSLKFAATLTGAQTTITPVGGYFTIPSDGYLFVTGGNDTDTAIWMTWSDWTEEPNGGVFEAYSQTSIDLSGVMVDFPAGLMRVGNVYDEINLNTLRAYSRIQRLAYTEENLGMVIASGVDYDTDTSYIYAVRLTPITYTISLDGQYTVSDHGMEIVMGTSVPVTVSALYGNDLKGKLRRDVLTISQQTLTDPQKAQVQDNIGGTERFALVQDDLDITIKGDKAYYKGAQVAVSAGQYVSVRGSTITGVTDGLYTAKNAVAINTAFTSADLQAVTAGGLNALNDKLNKEYTLIDSKSASGSTQTVTIPSSCNDIMVLVKTAGGTIAVYNLLPRQIFSFGAVQLSRYDGNGMHYANLSLSGNTLSIGDSSTFSGSTIYVYAK